MKIKVIFIGITIMAFAYSQNWTQIGSDIDGEAASDQMGYSVSLNSLGTRVIVGAAGNDGTGSGAGHARVFDESGGVWTQVGSDIDGEAAGDGSGKAVSISSDGLRVAIGATGNDGNGTSAGHVRVYEESGGVWSQVGSDIDGENAYSHSGFSVSLSEDGTRVAIGARYNDYSGTSNGQARIYEESGGVWTQIGSDIDGEAANDQFGYSISLSGDGARVVVGAYYNDGNGSNAGHARVYEESGGSWTQMGSDIDGEAAGDEAGHSVAISRDGTRIAVGATKADNSSGFATGTTKVFEWSGSAWNQIGSNIDGEEVSSQSGTNVSLSEDGTRVAIGAHQYGSGGADSNRGHVVVYEESSGVWTQVGSGIEGENAHDTSGWGVSISEDGNRVAIGAPFNDGANGTGSGHARIYEVVNSPTVTTTSISSIGSTTATSGGNVTDNGGASVTARGVCWSTSSGPTIADDITSDGTGTGSFTSSITGLTENTTYYVRAYATNSVGTSYGSELSFTTTYVEMDLLQSITSIADGGSYDYGNQTVGTDTDIVFTIENNGTEDLTITTPLTIGGTDAGEFSIESQPGLSTISASGNTTFTVRFSPTSTGVKTATISITNDDSDENPYDLNLTGTCLEYPFIHISGYINYSNGDPVEGVEVIFSNSGLSSTTNADGFYYRTISKGWSGTSAPVFVEHGFDPQSYNYSNVQNNYTNQDFVATHDGVIISGFIRDENNNGIEDFEITFNNSGATVKTSESGYYSTSVTYGWSGIAIPSKAGWTCTPDQKTYVNVYEDCPDQNYLGQLIALETEDDFSSIPDEFTILPAYPNPFNPSTTITYGLDENSFVKVAIYDISGKLITTLQDKEQPQGWHTIEWNGTDSNFNQVPAGIYLSRITSNNTTKTAKLMLLK